MLRFYIDCYLSNVRIFLGIEWKFDASPKCMPTSEMNKTGLEASGDQAFLQVFWHFRVLSRMDGYSIQTDIPTVLWCHQTWLCLKKLLEHTKT